MFNIIIHILWNILFAYCAFSVLYLLVFSFSGKFFYKQKSKRTSLFVFTKRIAILVPAYKEDEIIISTAKNLLNLDYPTLLFDVYVIADSFKKETLEKLQSMPVKVLEVSFAKSTKTKALNEAFKRIEKIYDIALICDADNMLKKDFLQKIHHAFANGAKAIQGRRIAKNLDTSFAVLDACSEAINNHIFRKGANAIGLSSAVIGSGMAFEFEQIKQILSEVDAVSGFDKVVQLKVVESGISIQYLEDALIFDEKVGSSHAFKKQRQRWIFSQFNYLKQYFVPGIKQLLKGNISYFNLAIAGNLVPPRAFFFILLPFLILSAFALYPAGIIFSFMLLVLYILSLVLALPVVFINKDLLRAVSKIPRAIGLMVISLFQMRKANETFIHTVHTKTEISNTLFNK